MPAYGTNPKWTVNGPAFWAYCPNPTPHNQDTTESSADGFAEFLSRFYGWTVNPPKPKIQSTPMYPELDADYKLRKSLEQ